MKTTNKKSRLATAAALVREAQTLATKATKGPWKVGKIKPGTTVFANLTVDTDGEAAGDQVCETLDDLETPKTLARARANARFIARSWGLVLELAAELETYVRAEWDALAPPAVSQADRLLSLREVSLPITEEQIARLLGVNPGAEETKVPPEVLRARVYLRASELATAAQAALPTKNSDHLSLNPYPLWLEPKHAEFLSWCTPENVLFLLDIVKERIGSDEGIRNIAANRPPNKAGALRRLRELGRALDDHAVPTMTKKKKAKKR